jgi:hypothetical protein
MFIDQLLITKSNDFNYFRGNQYTKNKIGRWKSGNRYLETMKKDTLSNGKIIVKFSSQIAKSQWMKNVI